MSKVIVAGSRSIEDDGFIYEVLDYHKPRIKEIVSGLAPGPDTFAINWAEIHKIPIKMFPADWETKGKRAGFLRNEEMAKYADILIAFWNGNSRGTFHMIQTALNKGLEVHVYQTTRT